MPNLFKSSNTETVKKHDFIPILVFVLILAVLLITSNLTGRPPVIKSLNKKSALPGEELVIYGNYFGDNREGGKVVIGGISPQTDMYQEWSNKKISLILPEEIKSGLVQIVTPRGNSREIIPFLNKSELPTQAAGPSRPGEPFISEVEPDKGRVGTVITLKGLNFGQNQGNSNLYFTWTDRAKGGQSSGDILSSMIPAHQYNREYITWTDREIVVRIPDGASSGPILIATDKGNSSPLYLEVEEPVGKKLFSTSITYQIAFTVKIEDINAQPDNGLFMWIPRVLETPEQRDIKVVYNEPEPKLPDYKGLMQFHFENLLPGQKYSIKLSYLFTRFDVTTVISNPYNITSISQETKEHLKDFLTPDRWVISDDKYVVGLAWTLTKKYKNPYFQAREIYNYIITKFNYIPSPFFPDNIHEILKSSNPSANAFTYAVAFCALTRSLGIPSRPVGGYIIDQDKQVARHFWAEFYVENLGWLPVDLVLGAGKKPVDMTSEEDPGTFYFGNLDHQHITFSKGVIDINQMNPRGKVIRAVKSPSLQTIYEESVGNLLSYTTVWSSLEDIGVY